jgi:hypothetical protein
MVERDGCREGCCAGLFRLLERQRIAAFGVVEALRRALQGGADVKHGLPGCHRGHSAGGERTRRRIEHRERRVGHLGQPERERDVGEGCEHAHVAIADEPRQIIAAHVRCRLLDASYPHQGLGRHDADGKRAELAAREQRRDARHG